MTVDGEVGAKSSYCLITHSASENEHSGLLIGEGDPCCLEDSQ